MVFNWYTVLYLFAPNVVNSWKSVKTCYKPKAQPVKVEKKVEAPKKAEAPKKKTGGVDLGMDSDSDSDSDSNSEEARKAKE